MIKKTNKNLLSVLWKRKVTRFSLAFAGQLHCTKFVAKHLKTWTLTLHCKNCTWGCIAMYRINYYNVIVKQKHHKIWPHNAMKIAQQLCIMKSTFKLHWQSISLQIAVYNAIQNIALQCIHNKLMNTSSLNLLQKQHKILGQCKFHCKMNSHLWQ